MAGLPGCWIVKFEALKWSVAEVLALACSLAGSRSYEPAALPAVQVAKPAALAAAALVAAAPLAASVAARLPAASAAAAPAVVAQQLQLLGLAQR